MKHFGNRIKIWDNTQIKPGMNWKVEIQKALSAAKVAILLVSSNFLASEFIRIDELPQLLEAAENDGTTIISLILNPCAYSEHPEQARFQAINDTNKSLAELSPVAQEKKWLS